MENLHKVYQSAESINSELKLNRRAEIKWLCGLRGAMAHVTAVKLDQLTADQAKFVISCQLMLTNDPFNSIKRNKLYNKILDILCTLETTEDVFNSCLEQIFCDTAVPDQISILLDNLFQMDRKLYLKLSAKYAVLPTKVATNLLVLKSILTPETTDINDHYSSEEIKHIFDIAEGCKDDQSLLIPLEVLELLNSCGGLESLRLPGKICYSLAHYLATGTYSNCYLSHCIIDRFTLILK